MIVFRLLGDTVWYVCVDTSRTHLHFNGEVGVYVLHLQKSRDKPANPTPLNSGGTVCLASVAHCDLWIISN